MAAAISQSLPPVIGSERDRIYADELDERLIQVFQNVSRLLRFDFSEQSIFHARVFVRLSLNQIFNSSMEEFCDRESLTKTLVNVSVQGARRGFFETYLPDKVDIYKNVNRAAQYPFTFTVNGGEETLFICCIQDPDKEGAFMMGKGEVVFRPNEAALKKLLGS